MGTLGVAWAIAHLVVCLPSTQNPSLHELGVVLHTCNTSTPEMRQEDQEFMLIFYCIQVWASLGCIRTFLSLSQKKRKNKTWQRLWEKGGLWGCRVSWKCRALLVLLRGLQHMSVMLPTVHTQNGHGHEKVLMRQCKVDITMVRCHLRAHWPPLVIFSFFFFGLWKYSWLLWKRKLPWKN